ncbi:hypothetical protein E2R55_14935 [Vibrio vulnificus]|nr:hypothetical protein E2R55_14935 [Vibrio vulnificus]
MERKVRDSCGKSVAWETPQACRGGSRPPAESECLEWKSTFLFYKPTKKCWQTIICRQRRPIF